MKPEREIALARCLYLLADAQDAYRRLKEAERLASDMVRTNNSRTEIPA